MHYASGLALWCQETRQWGWGWGGDPPRSYMDLHWSNPFWLVKQYAQCSLGLSEISGQLFPPWFVLHTEPEKDYLGEHQDGYSKRASTSELDFLEIFNLSATKPLFSNGFHAYNNHENHDKIWSFLLFKIPKLWELFLYVPQFSQSVLNYWLLGWSKRLN